ncbi:MAG: efflux RND transporter periplasmic adaptor subunit [Deltaproteobacteria bacterium]|nr:efflux RND transporter periplasmic adaptor subunit [Deltaproteobacteria bacterium]
MEEHLKQVADLLAAQKAARIDLLRTEVRLADLRQRLVKEKSNLAVQNRLLANLLGLDQGADRLAVAGSLAVAHTPDIVLDDLIPGRVETTQRLPRGQSQVGRAGRACWDAARASHWPTVSLLGSYGARVAGTGGSEDVGALGLGISVPLYDGGRTDAQVNQERAAFAAASERLRKLELLIRLEMETAVLDIRSSAERIEATRNAVEQAKESLRIERLIRPGQRLHHRRVGCPVRPTTSRDQSHPSHGGFAHRIGETRIGERRKPIMIGMRPVATFCGIIGLAACGVVALHQGSRFLQMLPGEKEAAAVIDTPSSQTAAAVPESKSLPLVAVETIQADTLVKTVAVTGAVTPTRTARLASPGEGPVETCAVSSCMVREGDRVEKGQALLQISRNKAAQAQLAAASQALKEQESELQRVTQLVQGGAVPGAQLDAARSKYENARAQLAKAMESAGDYLVEAPWSGIVSKVFVTEGDYVAPRTPLIEIFDPASLVVQFAVPETQCTEVHDGMPVEVQLDAHTGKIFPGTISRVYPKLDDKTRTRTVEATLSGSVALLPGMFARIQVVLARTPDAVTVPAYSLVPGPDGGYAAFVVEGEKAVRRKLDIGVEIDGRVHILSGLRAGDRVIVAGQEKLKDGASVKVLETAAAQTGAAVKAGDRS